MYRLIHLFVLLMLLMSANYSFAQKADTFGYEMFQRHGAVMLLVDPGNGRIVDANQAAVRYYGYSHEELLGMTIQQINTLSDVETRQEWELAARENRNYFIFRHQVAGGEIRPVEVYSWPIDFGGRKILFSIIHDVSERETLQESLVKSEVRLRHAERVAGLGHWTLDLNTGVYHFSQGAVELLGLTGETHDMESILESVLPESRPLMEQARKRLVDHGDEYAVQVRYHRFSDGKILDFYSQGYYDAGENSIFGVIHDVTDYAQAMRTLESRTQKFVLVMTVAVMAQFIAILLLVYHVRRRKTVEQALLNRETQLKQSEKQLRAKNTELESFANTVTHDLKSPLVTIRTFSEYLRQDLNNGDQLNTAKDLDYISGAAQKMMILLDELAEFSRVGRVKENMVDVSFSELVQEVLALVAGRIAHARVEVDSKMMDIALRGDGSQLVALWQNLVDNAVKYMGEQPSPRIEIGVEPRSESPVFYVRDNGKGVDPKDHEQIFLLFKRVEQDGEGTGFGLALVKRIVELYGGRIWVESQGLGLGACFYFTLPMAVVEN